MMYFANFRTTTIEESTKNADVKKWAMKFSAPNSKLEHGDTMEGFLRKIEKQTIKEVYFHDLNFSGSFIVQWLMKNGFTPVGIDEKDEDGKPVQLGAKEWKYICNERGGIYVITAVFANGHKVNFIDSWKTLTSTYEELKEAAGIEEDLSEGFLWSDFTDEEQEKLTLKGMEEEIDSVIYSYIKALSKYKKKLTRSSMSLDNFKTFYNKENKSGRAFSVDFGGSIWNYKEKCFKAFNVLSKKQWNYVHKSFSGGYNAWKEGIEGKLWKVPNGVKYDVNKMHISIAESNKVPYGKMLTNKPLHGDYATLITVNIGKAEKKNPHAPNLIKKAQGKYKAAEYVAEVEHEERTYWLEEWEFILKHYEIEYIEVKRRYFRKKRAFQSWLDSLKEQMSHNNDGVEMALDKGIGNGGIGKMAQAIKMGARVIVKDGFTVKVIKSPMIFSDYKHNDVQLEVGDRVLVDSQTGELFRKLSVSSQRYGADGEYRHEVRFEEVEQRGAIHTASYVYMLARIKLWKAIFANIDIWLYSDSDSAFFSDAPRGIPIHSTKYGFWKPEQKFDRIKILRGKAYVLRATHYWKNGRWIKEESLVKKVSGLNAIGKAFITLDNFNVGQVIPNGKNAMATVDGGKIKYKTDYTIGEKVFI